MEIILRILIMAFLIAAGIVCYKTKIITNEVSRGLSDIALKVATPALLISSFQREPKPEEMKRLGYAAILAVLAILLSVLIGYLAVRKSKNYPKDDNGRLSIERFSAIYSNCAFMGIPLINGIYGEEGVFYLTAFYAVFNIAVWTHGVVMIKGETGVKQVLKALASPALIGIALGMVFFFFGVTLPDFIKQTLDYAGAMTTPLGMLVAGAAIAQSNLAAALKKLRIYWVTVLRLIIIPLATIGLFKLLPYDETVMGVTVAASACPAAAICTMFAVSYNKDSLYAGELFAVSTMLSMITLPLIMQMMRLLNG